MKHLHALKPTRGASGLEYAMLLGLIGGIGIIAVSSFAVDTRRAFEAPTVALASTVPGLSSSAPGGAESVFPDDPTPADPEPTPPEYAPRWVIGGFWAATGSHDVQEMAAPDAVFPAGDQVGDKLDESLTFTGASIFEVAESGGHPRFEAVALYAAERPGQAFIVSRTIANPIGIRFTVPAGPTLNALPFDLMGYNWSEMGE